MSMDFRRKPNGDRNLVSAVAVSAFYGSVVLNYIQQMISCDDDVCRRIVTDLTLNGEEATVTNILKSLKIRREGYASLTESNLLEIGDGMEVLRARRYLIDKLRVGALKHNSVLSVSMDDVILKGIYRRNGIVSRYHNQICRIEVDGNSTGTKAVKELLEHSRGLGTRLYSEMRADAVGITGKLEASPLHDLIAVNGLVLGNNSDMGGHDVRLQLLCKIEYSLGLLDENGISFRAEEALSKVSAESGKFQAVGLNDIKKLSSLCGSEIFGRIFSLGAIHLNTCGAYFSSLEDRSFGVGSEGVDDYADREIKHNITSFLCDKIVFFIKSD